MSMSKWGIYGYGVNISLQEINAEKAVKFLRDKKHLDEEDLEWLDKVKEPNFSDIEEHWGCHFEFFSELLSSGEFGEADKFISYADDGDSESSGIFFLYTPNYPWQMSDIELGLSKKDVQNMITQIITTLTNLEESEIMERFENVSTGGEG